ncbi:chemotaxis protein CheB [Pseudoduganella sp. LjRoot289]|uniref:chemotaxis protein CheB n=1 Tax=Pseudoduganella sp. LjRoot289 TaxID=3342314 RepID=UPI003ECD9919
MKQHRLRYRAVVLGVSMGGVDALKRVLPLLPAAFPLPLLVVIHVSPGSGDGLARLLDTLCQLRVKEADEGDLPQAGTVYMAPANYHLLVERDGSLGLSTDPPVSFARPSVDVLFESAAACHGKALVGVVLTGAGADGAAGIARVARLGGYTVVQDPADAQMDLMPRAALARLCHLSPSAQIGPNAIATLEQLPLLLQRLAGLEEA